jgi:hypothetical protein
MKDDRKPSRRQVRAWLATVLAPLELALRGEAARTEEGHWVFRAAGRDLEGFADVERWISARFVPNLEQLWRHRSPQRQLAIRHDRSLRYLRETCRRAFDALVQSEGLAQLAGDATRLPALAELVVNGRRDAPADESLRDLWPARADELLALRETSAVAEELRLAESAGKSFHAAAVALLEDVARTQGELADEFRLPPVDPESAA